MQLSGARSSRHQPNLSSPNHRLTPCLIEAAAPRSLLRKLERRAVTPTGVDFATGEGRLATANPPELSEENRSKSTLIKASREIEYYRQRRSRPAVERSHVRMTPQPALTLIEEDEVSKSASLNPGISSADAF
jgi:hypothetical protein